MSERDAPGWRTVLRDVAAAEDPAEDGDHTDLPVVVSEAIPGPLVRQFVHPSQRGYSPARLRLVTQPPAPAGS